MNKGSKVGWACPHGWVAMLLQNAFKDKVPFAQFITQLLKVIAGKLLHDEKYMLTCKVRHRNPHFHNDHATLTGQPRN
jgi:hypothetical protein